MQRQLIAALGQISALVTFLLLRSSHFQTLYKHSTTMEENVCGGVNSCLCSQDYIVGVDREVVWMLGCTAALCELKVHLTTHPKASLRW